MFRLVITISFLALCSDIFAAVQAYSVADDNFEMPDHLVLINLETGEYESKGKIADPYIALEGLAMSSDGVLYGADDNTKTLVQINTAEARAFPVNNVNQNLGFGAIPDSYDFGLTFSCQDKLHMVVKDTQELYEVNTTTGKAELIGNTGHNFTSVASWGNDLYAIASGDFTLYRLNKNTAAATAVGSLGDLGGDIELAGSGMAFDESGDLWMVVNLRLSDPLNPFPSRVFKIDTTTGQATLISETLVGIESLAITGPGGCSLGGGQADFVPVPINDSRALLLMLISMLVAGVVSLRSRT